MAPHYFPTLRSFVMQHRSPSPSSRVHTSNHGRRTSHPGSSPPKRGVPKHSASNSPHREAAPVVPTRERKPIEATPNSTLDPRVTEVVQDAVKEPPTTVDPQNQRLVPTNDNQEEQPVPTPVESAEPGDEARDDSNDTAEDSPAEQELRANTDDIPAGSPSLTTSPQKDKIQTSDSPLETEVPKTDLPGVGISPPTPGGDVDRSNPGTGDENGSHNVRSGILQRLDDVEQGQDPGANQPKEFLPGAKREHQGRWMCYVYGSLILQLCLIVGSAYLLRGTPGAFSWIVNNLWALGLVGVAAFFNLIYLAARPSDDGRIVYLGTFIIMKTILWAYLIVSVRQTSNAARVIFIIVGFLAGQMLYNWNWFSSNTAWNSDAFIMSIITGSATVYLVHLNMPFDSAKAAVLILAVASGLILYVTITTYVAGLGANRKHWTQACVALYIVALGCFLVAFYDFRKYLLSSYNEAIRLLRQDLRTTNLVNLA